MSIDINWDALAGGSDGLELAESIRAFIHERFQQIELPRFIRSVKVHAFEFGTVAPELQLKDVCDPLTDFYQDDDDDAATPDEQAHGHYESSRQSVREDPIRTAEKISQAHSLRLQQRTNAARPHRPSIDTNISYNTFNRMTLGTSNLFLSRTSTPGIPGGTSNMGYFHLPLSAGISGAATPLATAVGATFAAGWPEHLNSSSNYHNHVDDESPPESRRTSFASRQSVDISGDEQHTPSDRSDATPEKSVEDVQIVMHLKYSGDIRMSLTAEILLDYPMPSFVGIPLKLTVTGLTFDGVAILAYIKSKAHFCFLAPEDAEALVGRSPDGDVDEHQTGTARRHQEKRVGGLFEEIKVESEIGQRTAGKQVLKNVGKVEKFVLEQVRRIFESEFVYPSFWTFLV